MLRCAVTGLTEVKSFIQDRGISKKCKIRVNTFFSRVQACFPNDMHDKVLSLVAQRAPTLS